ncbi:hypothetical protein AB0J86_37825 [Micromonospora sp. NPDC049559]|uniref:hypothetical protein n=1 Tax=Micromonospora sp. NPDC049559 TaxID=3155923 RepID=UPI00341A0EF1
MTPDPIRALVRDLLLRRLAGWAPAALRRARRATFVQAYAGPDAGSAEAAVRILAGLTDAPRGRLTAVTLAAHPGDLAVRLDDARASLPATVDAHLVPGGPDRVPVALAAAGATGAPLLAWLDADDGPAPERAVLAAVTAGRPAELLLLLGGSARLARPELREAGFRLVTDVQLDHGPGPDDDSGASRRLVFATSSGKSLEAFKEALWSTEGHGVRYEGPEGLRLDAGAEPDSAPLRGDLLGRLREVGEADVTELREFTLTETLFRAEDTNRALTALLAEGAVTRTPEEGRLGGDVVIRPAGR